jgi:hypothetical protein
MTLPAAASLGIADLLRGSPLPGFIRGTTSGGGWLDLGGHVVVLTGPGVPRLPNGVLVTDLDLLPADGHCVAGDSRLTLGEIEIDVVRWWDPRPVFPPFALDTLAARAGEASHLLECPVGGKLCDAVRSGDPVAIRAGARGLLGWGRGLTPEGDDVLAGVLAGLALLGGSIDEERSIRALKALAPVIESEAPFRTSNLSASLLRHAAAGETAGPVGALIRSLAGRGDLASAITGLDGLGASSGVAMGCGVLLAVDALMEGVNV